MNRAHQFVRAGHDGAAGAEILLTGATGFLGKVVLEELVRRRDELGIGTVHLLIRRAGRLSAAERFERKIASSPCFAQLPDHWSDVVTVVEGDLTQDGMGLGDTVAAALAERVEYIVNCAASIDFDLALARATETNVTSALNVLEFARTCTHLEQMVNVSTAYVTPHTDDHAPVPEELVDLPFDPEQVYESIRAGIADADALMSATGHPNTYTLTKCLAEHLLAERRGDVPLTLVRPSIISAAWAQPFPGWIDSTSAFAGFVLLAGTGYLRAIHGREETALDIVPVDAVADHVIEAARASRGDTASLAIEHAVAGVHNAARIDLCRDVVISWFRRHPVARGAHVSYLGSDPEEFARRERLHNTGPAQLTAAWYGATRRKREQRRARRLIQRLEYINRAFPYFTSNTFRFETSQPISVVGFDTKQYIETVCRGIYRHLLDLDEREATLAGPDRQGMGDVTLARRQPHGNIAHRFSSVIVSKGLRRTTERITFDRPSFERARLEVDPDSLLVIVPTHRSYMDFVLCSYLAFTHPDLGIPIPHVAAAREFSHIPALGWLLEKNQAFYIDRNKGRADPELTRRVRELADRQHTLEFFIEGTRSRTRRFLPPKRGILRSLQSTGVPCTILPIAISYDHVPEERPFLAELAGGPKPDMKLRPLLGWAAKLFAGKIDIGRVHMACGNPLPMDDHTDVVALSNAIVGELQEHTATTTHHIRSFLHHNPVHGADEHWMRAAIEARGATVIDSPLQDTERVPGRLERSMQAHWLHVFYPEARALWGEHPVVARHIDANTYAPIGRREAELPTDPRVIALLQRVLAPICADHAYTAATLAASGTITGTRTRDELARLLAAREPAAFVADIETALENMRAEGLIDTDAEGKVVARASRAAFDAHAARCATLPAPAPALQATTEQRV